MELGDGSAIARIVIEELNQDRFEGLRLVYNVAKSMFSPGLSAQLLAFAYRNEDPEKPITSCAQCLYIKAHRAAGA